MIKNGKRHGRNPASLANCTCFALLVAGHGVWQSKSCQYEGQWKARVLGVLAQALFSSSHGRKINRMATAARPGVTDASTKVLPSSLSMSLLRARVFVNLSLSVRLLLAWLSLSLSLSRSLSLCLCLFCSSVYSPCEDSSARVASPELERWCGPKQ